MLVVLPWSAFWDRNYFAAHWPLLRAAAGSPYARGAVSGIGAINIVAGFAELVGVFVIREPRLGPGPGFPPVPPQPSHPDGRADS